MAKPTDAERRAAAEANWNGPVQDAIRDHDQKIAERQEKGKPS
jgi:hypothetical protein